MQTHILRDRSSFYILLEKRDNIADGLAQGVDGSDGAAIDDPSGNLNVWESKPTPWHGTRLHP